MHWLSCSPLPTRPRSWWSCESPKRSASSISITVAFGTSIPTSITVVATSTSDSPETKRAIASVFSREVICPCSRPTRKPASSPFASLAASALAAFASSCSESATSGQTTYAWRPSRSRSRTNS